MANGLVNKTKETDGGVQTAPARAIIMMAVVGAVFFVFQTILHAWIGPFGYGPDIFLILILYLGLYAPFASGACLSAVLGFFIDAGGGMLGFNAFIMYTLFLVIFVIRQNLDPSGPWFLTVFSFIFSLIANALAFCLLNIFGNSFFPDEFSWSNPFISAFISSLTTAAVCPLVFKLLDFAQVVCGVKSESD